MKSKNNLQFKQTGFAAIAAIFILVVLSALGGYILMVSTQQQTGSAFDFQSEKAYEAARTGIEWGLFKQLRQSSCVASSSWIPNAPALLDFTVTVKCSTSTDSTGGPVGYFVQSTACNQPTSGKCPNTTNPNSLYIERRLDVSF